MVDLLTAIIVVLDLVLSVWNCYSAGVTSGLLKREGGPAWANISVVLGLAMGLSGAVYVTAILVSAAAYWLGLIGSGAADLLLAYNAVITGLLIVVIGIGVTIQSIYIAVRKPGFMTIATALYNTFASIWNVFSYISNFGPATQIINYERRNERQSSLVQVIIIAVIAVLLGVLLAYFAYWMGRNHAEGRRLRTAPSRSNIGI